MGIYVLPSFSDTYSLIELRKMGKFSWEIGICVEPFVSSSDICDAGRTFGVFSFWACWVSVSWFFVVVD